MKKNEGHKFGKGPEKNVHRAFQLCALLLIGYIIYNLYMGNSVTTQPQSIIDVGGSHYLTNEEINEKVRAEMVRLAETEEFKDIKDFAAYMQSNIIEKDHGKILDAKDGILIYVPNKLLNQSGNETEIENEIIKIRINSEKKLNNSDKALNKPESGVSQEEIKATDGAEKPQQ